MGSHEEGQRRGREVHVVVVPCPTQGHINPLLQFAKHLAHRGLNVTLPTILTNSNPTHLALHTSLTIQHVSLLPYQGTEPENPLAFWDRRQASIRLHLTELLTRRESSGDSVDCIVYDSMMPWVLDVAKKFGVLGASFFTQSSAVNAIYYNVYKGWLNVPLQEKSVLLEGQLPVLQPSDLSTFVSESSKYQAVLSFLTDQFKNLDVADWILVNTFDSLEPKVRSRNSKLS